MFKQFSMLCNQLGLYGKEVIAVDGSKFRANNSRRKNYTKNKVKKMLEHYEQVANKYIELLNDNDNTEEESTSFTKDEIKTRLDETKKRIEELTEMAEEIKKNGEISITDPDAKHMSVSNNGTDISHNVQIAVDSKNHLVVAVDVVSSPADQNQLHNMSLKAVEELGLKKNIELENNNQEEVLEKEIIKVLADKGYYCGEELEKCKKDNIKTIVPKQKSCNKTGEEEYLKEKFIYNEAEDIYICPNGEILLNVSKESSKDKRYKNTKVCSKCKDKDKCTTSKEGRVIRRGLYQEVYDEVDKITIENKELYKQRQMLVEHPFGTVKRALGFTYFLTRGNESVKAESFMHFLTYNIIRVINIMGVKKLTEIFKAKTKGFFVNFSIYIKSGTILVNY